MKGNAILWILLAILLCLAGIVIYRIVTPPKPGYAVDAPKGGVVSRVMDAVLPEPEPSPYSIKWGARMARIVDQDGNAVPQASVTFTKHLQQDCEGTITEEPPAWQGISVTTNDNGEFECPAVIWEGEFEEEKDKPTIYVSIEAEGFLARKGVRVGINYADDNGQIDLFRVGRIEGAIIDPNGQPLANVPLWFNTHTYYKNPGESCSGCFSANIKTDEAGSFVIEKVPPGQHIIKFPGYSGGCGPEPKIEKIPFEEYATFQTVNMKDGETKTNVFLDLRQGRGTIRGKVVDKYNRPMAGVNAVLYRVIKQYFDNGSGWSSSTENLKSAKTDENGDYVLSHIPSGDYQLQAQYPYEKGKNYKSGEPLNIYLAGKQEVTFNLVLKRQDDSLPKLARREDSLFEVPQPDDLGLHDMMIVDPRGNGIAGASVAFEDTITIEDKETGKKTRKEWDGTSLTTDSRGVFTLPEIFEDVNGKWECYASIKAEGYQQRRAWLRSYYQKKDCRVDILPLSEIRGQLIGWDGKPVKGAVALLNEMTAYHNPGSASSGGGYGGIATDEVGRFDFIQVPEGTHVFQYKASNPKTNKEHVGSFVIYIQSGKNIDDLIIDLRKDTCIAQGRVLDWDGKPIKNATVRLSKSVQWGYEHFGQSASSVEIYRSEETNRKGEYSIENIRPGVYEIEAVLEGDQQRTSEKMTIALGDNQSIDLDVRLKR